MGDISMLSVYFLSSLPVVVCVVVLLFFLPHYHVVATGTKAV